MLFQDGDSKEPGLSPEQFVHKYGRPPWEVLNETLARLGVSAAIQAPPGTEVEPFTPRMQSPNGDPYQASDLSSGEKVILNLALCGYQAAHSGGETLRPKLVLLDEVDAPLHPQMTKIYLDVISDVLVQTFGMSVIATTHSPSTVAMFPSDEIFVMERGVAGPRSTTKDAALASLTAGVPTLSISTDGRRQVFVESPADVENYEALYRIARPYLNSERTLQFISTGAGATNTGCAIIYEVVTNLAAKGAPTTYGLVDWDNKNSGTDRIVVLANGLRDGLENVVFDPLAMVLAIYRDFPKEVGALGLDAARTFQDFFSFPDATALQPLVTAFVAHVLGAPASSVRTVHYAGGLILDIDEAYLTIDDHDLEIRLLASISRLREKSKGQAGKLMAYIIEIVLSNFPQAIPKELLDTFDDLLNR